MARTQTPITVLYDGRCSLCARSAAALGRLDRGRGRLRLLDFRANPDAVADAGITPGAMEGAMHAVHPDGGVSVGPEAVRAALRAVGLGPAAKVLGWPVIGPLFGRLYDLVARNRLKWFARREAAPEGCDNGACRIDHR